MSLRRLHDEFTGQFGAFPEAPDYPLHLRWARICSILTDMARRTLAEPMDDVYARVVERGTYTELAQCLSLVQLQVRFHALLLNRRLIMPHQYDHLNAGYCIWQERICDGIKRTQQAHRHKGKIIPEKRSAPTSFPWLN